MRFGWIRSPGRILRATIEADTKGSVQFKQAAIMVQYGPVQIGESEFICPVRSLALSIAARRQSRSAHPHAGRRADRMAEREPVHGVSSVRLHDEDRQDIAAQPQPQDLGAQPGRLQGVSPPADSTVIAKQKQEIPDEYKQADVPDLPAQLPDAPDMPALWLAFLPCTSSFN